MISFLRSKSIRFILVAIPVCLSFLSLSCLYPLNSDKPADPLQVATHGTVNDTISPFGPLGIVFSTPVKNPDSVRLVFTPVHNEYRITWNKSFDTAVIQFPMPLKCDTAYSLYFAAKVESVDDEVLLPGADTLTIITWSCEQESNDSRNLADPFKGRMFGRIATANDTDWFAPSDTVARTFYLKSTISSSSLAIRDRTGAIFAPSTYAPAETLTAPSDFAAPIHLLVHAHNRSNGGYYELGVHARP